MGCQHSKEKPRQTTKKADLGSEVSSDISSQNFSIPESPMVKDPHEKEHRGFLAPISQVTFKINNDLGTFKPTESSNDDEEDTADIEIAGESHATQSLSVDVCISEPQSTDDGIELGTKSMDANKDKISSSQKTLSTTNSPTR
mmetsp:Transcript_32504/g.39525  ORF Transcript_32504/g.39525 Transcript_32504/m.39525 type:complete len:143 (+) Transcript_32504:81-509(+)